MSLIQIFTLLMPILAYPYLIRNLGMDGYGKAIYAYSIGQYFSILIQFGFSLSGTKVISQNLEDKCEINRIVSSILMIRFLIFIISSILFLWIYFFFFNDVIYFYSYLYVVGDVFLLNYYYQGFQNLKKFALVGFISKLVLLILLLSYIDDESDVYLYCLLTSLCYIVSNVLFFMYSIRNDRLKLVFDLKFSFKVFIDSFYIFLSRVPVVFVEKINILVLGTFVSNTAVSYYDLAAKLTALLQMPFNIFNQIYYPKASRDKDIKAVISIVRTAMVIALVIYGLGVLLGKYVINYYAGESMIATYDIFVILSLILPINTLSHNFGNCVLISLDKVKEFNFTVYFPAFFYVFFMLTLIYFKLVTVVNVIILFVFYVFLICLLRTYFVLKVARNL
ncbi:oligosaccharide flippase family protein [Pseudoalteromonas citrea]|nr:oligosaccharide flippase family protein [Pseudoalteromonas citrea]